MAQTYTATAQNVTFASNKSMLALMNNTGSGRVLRVKRIWVLNNQTAGITGVMTTFVVRRITSATGGTAVNAVRHNTLSETVASITQVTITHDSTIAFDSSTEMSTPFRSWVWSNDEAAISGSGIDEFQCFIPLNCFFDAATGDADIEPIVLRAGQGISIHHTGTSAVGNCDVIIEFTMAAT